MTARTVARLRDEGKEFNEMTERNIEKVTQFRQGGEDALEEMVKKIRNLKVEPRNDAITREKKRAGSGSEKRDEDDDKKKENKRS
jgi:large subunit ribosomal protein L17